MIARSPAGWQAPPWQQQLANVIRDPVTLFAELGLDPQQAPPAWRPLADTHLSFPLRVPRPFVARMRPGDWQDPLLLQVLPAAAELLTTRGFDDDPLRERAHNPVPGLIHKYQGRVLLIASGGCAINCRYCFRREFPYADNNPGSRGWQQALDYISADTSIEEVILSGGDPLAADDRHLARLVDDLASMAHVMRLRVHTRLPVVIPARINPDLISWLGGGRLRPVLVLHCNHPRELDANVAAALAQLREAGIPLLNQSVLLAGINDNGDTLVELSKRLFELGVMPYYLHLLDRVSGAAHFEVTSDRARALLGDLLARLPGYLVPRLVRDQAGAASKLPVAPML